MGANPLARVFVYGTLRQGYANHGRDVLTTHGTLVGEGTAPGRLYDLGDFPAMTEPVDGDDRVRGELYRLERESERGLERLDRYEGARGPSPLPYERRRVDVALDDGDTLEAWTYVWTEDPPEDAYLEGGDWIAHVQTRS